jgi:hypothetical protein
VMKCPKCGGEAYFIEPTVLACKDRAGCGWVEGPVHWFVRRVSENTTNAPYREYAKGGGE